MGHDYLELYGTNAQNTYRSIHKSHCSRQYTLRDVIERYFWNGFSREHLKAMKALYALKAMKALYALYPKYANVLVEKLTLVEKNKILNLKPNCIYYMQSIEQRFYRETEEQNINGCKLLVKKDAMLDSLDA